MLSMLLNSVKILEAEEKEKLESKCRDVSQFM